MHVHHVGSPAFGSFFWTQSFQPAATVVGWSCECLHLHASWTVSVRCGVTCAADILHEHAAPGVFSVSAVSKTSKHRFADTVLTLVHCLTRCWCLRRQGACSWRT